MNPFHASDGRRQKGISIKSVLALLALQADWSNT